MKTTNVEVTPIDLSTLNAEQLKALRKAMSARAKSRTGDIGKRNKLIDAMLHETEGDGYRNTTSDILAALQAKDIVAKDLTVDERAVELKKIQTRKQLLVKKDPTAKVGYKVSPTGIGALTVERAVAFLKANAPELLK